MKTVRLAAAVVLAAAALGGCSAVGTVQTKVVYAASDGARVTLGSTVEGINLLVLTSGEGQPGALVGAVANRDEQDAVVTIQVEGAAPAEVAVPAKGTVHLTGEQLVRLDSVPARPGATVPVTISTGAEGSVSLAVPVLDGTLPEYAEVIAGL